MEKPAGPQKSKEQELLEQVVQVSLDKDLPRSPADNAFGRFVDRVGPLAPVAGGVLTLLIFLGGLLGGPDLAWLAFFYLIPVALFLLTVPYLIRRNRREEIKAEMARREKRAMAHEEIARYILKENRRGDKKRD